MKKNISAICVGLPITLIFAIAVSIKAAWISHFDHFFQQVVHVIPHLQGIMLKITFLASPKMDLLWMLLLCVILWLKKRRPLALNIVITLLSADAIGWVIKQIIHRARPMQHLAIDDGYSFPSGHVLGMAIIVIWIMMVLLPAVMKNQRQRILLDILLVIWLIVVMCSRVYVYAHYPSDVIGSVFIALTWLGIVQLILHEFEHRFKK